MLALIYVCFSCKPVLSGMTPRPATHSGSTAARRGLLITPSRTSTASGVSHSKCFIQVSYAGSSLQRSRRFAAVFKWFIMHAKIKCMEACIGVALCVSTPVQASWLQVNIKPHPAGSFFIMRTASVRLVSDGPSSDGKLRHIKTLNLPGKWSHWRSQCCENFVVLDCSLGVDGV